MTAGFDVAVLGAGLAGLSSAILLARDGYSVAVFEQDELPKHRVCGEYVSREVMPFISELGLDVNKLGAKQLNRFELTSRSGRVFRCPLDLGGFGLSRYRLDHALVEVARACGVQVFFKNAVSRVEAREQGYWVEAAGGDAFTARVVLGAFGKRSKLDHVLGRINAKRRSPYVGVKRHFRGEFPQDLVGLHAIPGGYCGISAVENDLVNVCYLTNDEALKEHGSVAGFEVRGLRSNPTLALYLAALKPAFDRPLVISQVDFADKSTVEGHVLMLGDAAGLIHPLAGNGMAMALRSAARVAPMVSQFLRGTLTRQQLELAHRAAWQREFGTRRLVSRLLQRGLESVTLSEFVCGAADAAPLLARFVIRSTHGSTF